METNSNQFSDVLDQLPGIGKEYHGNQLIENALSNKKNIDQTLADLPKPSGKKKETAMVICAGPSLINRKSIEKIKNSGFEGSIVTIDGAYVACLRHGLVPDYVLTLDPHPTRVVAWFGGWKPDPNDDYYKRQDLDKEFRAISVEKDRENKELVNRYGSRSKAIVCVSSPQSVVDRLREAKISTYWWNPLVDNPNEENSITRKLYDINSISCMNTGGNVGTAAWVFASEILGCEKIGMVGMDFGYEESTPIENTQTYYELIKHNGWSKSGLEQFFLETEFPLTGENYYTDPTFYWYRTNFFELLAQSSKTTVNCTEGGTLFGSTLPCKYLDEFLKEVR